ncbi:hypothetical protein [Streptomyces sp. NPDC002133]|uniref:hypothetical protein n=1 Tax=Streptomyces sp. NPDC002133 TaxID=3154409 RepID=UPI003319225E
MTEPPALLSYTHGTGTAPLLGDTIGRKSQTAAGGEALRAKLEEAESELSGVTGLPPLDPVTGIAALIEGRAGTPLPVKRSWVAFCTIVTLLPANGKHARTMTTDDHVSVDRHHLAEGGDED